MQISELLSQLPKEVIESASRRGMSALTPPQELAVRNGLLIGGNFVIASPTASGKTFIAEMAMLKAVLHDYKKAIYVAPMRALVSEKYAELKEAYPYLSIAISIGDLDSLDQWLAKYDIVLVSTEKLDSLIRHGADWVQNAGVIIIDEVHMLDDASRGPTLDILMTKLRSICENVQIIALSATVGNADEIAEWLGAKLIESDYRPIKLEKGIVYEGMAYYPEEEPLYGASKIPELRVMEDTLHRKKQALLFYGTKRNAEAGAEKLSQIVERHITLDEKAKLHEISDSVMHALSRPTAQCEKLARLIDKGVAFHHSGLVNEQRHLVEQAFKDGIIKAIAATPTLAYGVNMPAHTVVVRDISRYSDSEGAERLGINEVTQLFGRAGRPKYDKEGRGLLLARSRSDIVDLYKKYINAPLDPVSSKLGVLPVLRTHVLSFVATEMLRTQEAITGFLSKTFYGFEFGDKYELSRLSHDILKELAEWEFIEQAGSAFEATRLGKRISELYIDPLSARWIVNTLPKATDDVGILFTVANTLEMRPYVKAVDEAEMLFPKYKYLLRNSHVNYEESMPYYDPVAPLGTALMLRDWSEEMPERDIAEKYSATPGSLFTKITNADWLLYSSIEIAKLIRVSTAQLHEMRIRVKYGIKKELLDLTRLEQVGRVRARLMYNAGIKTVSDIRKEGSSEKITRLFGKEVAKKILDQVR